MPVAVEPLLSAPPRGGRGLAWLELSRNYFTEQHTRPTEAGTLGDG